MKIIIKLFVFLFVFPIIMQTLSSCNAKKNNSSLRDDGLIGKREITNILNSLVSESYLSFNQINSDIKKAFSNYDYIRFEEEEINKKSFLIKTDLASFSKSAWNVDISVTESSFENGKYFFNNNLSIVYNYQFNRSLVKIDKVILNSYQENYYGNDVLNPIIVENFDEVENLKIRITKNREYVSSWEYDFEQSNKIYFYIKKNLTSKEPIVISVVFSGNNTKQDTVLQINNFYYEKKEPAKIDYTINGSEFFWGDEILITIKNLNNLSNFSFDTGNDILKGKAKLVSNQIKFKAYFENENANTIDKNKYLYINLRSENDSELITIHIKPIRPIDIDINNIQLDVGKPTNFTLNKRFKDVSLKINQNYENSLVSFLNGKIDKKENSANYEGLSEISLEGWWYSSIMNRESGVLKCKFYIEIDSIEYQKVLSYSLGFEIVNSTEQLYIDKNDYNFISVEEDKKLTYKNIDNAIFVKTNSSEINLNLQTNFFRKIKESTKFVENDVIVVSEISHIFPSKSENFYTVQISINIEKIKSIPSKTQELKTVFSYKNNLYLEISITYDENL
ncbi:hypothetical protein [Spiroplasma tabanidicola]|uniref:Lipoprotein n=1 Tax=Spiroplasma tabanidicola TaxID=324079 RepID=A0A6I6CA02_9MOLU|nr:hypothetical protein [Spiroplasma tabanidicola]QGS51765.1 hypothetical protein STABA_v1c04020 [Spiroplasma tabanidicola]